MKKITAALYLISISYSSNFCFASFDPQVSQKGYMIPRAEALNSSGAYVLFNYMSNAAGNPVGGLQQGAAYCDSYFLGLGYDFSKLTPLEGFSIKSSLVF